MTTDCSSSKDTGSRRNEFSRSTNSRPRNSKVPPKETNLPSSDSDAEAIYSPDTPSFRFIPKFRWDSCKMQKPGKSDFSRTPVSGKWQRSKITSPSVSSKNGSDKKKLSCGKERDTKPRSVSEVRKDQEKVEEEPTKDVGLYSTSSSISSENFENVREQSRSTPHLCEDSNQEAGAGPKARTRHPEDHYCEKLVGKSKDPVFQPKIDSKSETNLDSIYDNSESESLKIIRRNSIKAIPTVLITDYDPAVVVDNGSGMCKAGFANEANPRCIIPSLIGRPRYPQILLGRPEHENYVGELAQKRRGVLSLKYPIEKGVIEDWNDMELIWEHVFDKELGISNRNQAILMTEAPMTPKRNRERMIEVLFEKFNFPACHVAIQAILALYASGKTTGIVFDSGDGVSHSVPIFDGYYLTHAVERSNIAGSAVTEYLGRILTQKGLGFGSNSYQEIVRDIKEKICEVLPFEKLRDFSPNKEGSQTYSLPDGSKTEVGTERFQAPECLFRPGMLGSENPGIHQIIYNSIMKCDIDNRRELLSNVLLSGGNTLFPGFSTRLTKEIDILTPEEIKTAIIAPLDRSVSVWKGGAILAAMECFIPFWVSRTEYEDQGIESVTRKCF